jgi:hypothetical protein
MSMRCSTSAISGSGDRNGRSSLKSPFFNHTHCIDIKCKSSLKGNKNDTASIRDSMNPYYKMRMPIKRDSSSSDRSLSTACIPALQPLTHSQFHISPPRIAITRPHRRHHRRRVSGRVEDIANVAYLCVTFDYTMTVIR